MFNWAAPPFFLIFSFCHAALSKAVLIRVTWKDLCLSRSPATQHPVFCSHLWNVLTNPSVWHPGSTFGSVTFEMDSTDVMGLSDLCFPESHRALLTHQDWGPAGSSLWRSSCSPLSSWFSSFVSHCWDTAAKGISGGGPDELHCVFVTLEFPVKFI